MLCFALMGHRKNELLHNTKRFLEMELWRFKVYNRRGIMCTAQFEICGCAQFETTGTMVCKSFFSHTQRAFLFIFDRLYLMTRVSSGDGKYVIFLSFDSSFMWCENFCPGRTFYFDDFYFIGKL